MKVKTITKSVCMLLGALSGIAQAYQAVPDLETKRILESTTKEFHKPENNMYNNIRMYGAGSEKDKSWWLKSEPVTQNGAEKVEKFLGLFNSASYPWSNTNKGYKSAVKGIITTNYNFQIGENYYIALGYSEGSIRIYLLDTDKNSPNYMLPKVTDSQNCDLADHPEVLKLNSWDEESLPNACKLISAPYITPKGMLGSDSGKSEVNVPVSAFLWMPAVDNGKLSETEGILYTAYDSTTDETGTWTLSSNILPNYTTSTDRHGGLLLFNTIQVSDDTGKIDLSNTPFTVKLSERSDEPGMYVLGKDGKANAAAISSLIPLIIERPNNMFSAAILVKADSKPEHSAGYSVGFKATTLFGYPMVLPDDSTIGYITDSAKDGLGFGDGDGSFEVNAIVNGSKASRLYDLASNYDSDKSEIEKSANISVSAQGPNYYYEGTKDGTVLKYGFDGSANTPEFHTLNYKNGDAIDMVDLDSEIVFLNYDYMSNILTIASESGSLVLLGYLYDESAATTSGWKDYTFKKVEMGHNKYPTASFSNLGNMYIIFNDGSVAKVYTDNDELKLDVIIQKSDLYKNVSNVKLSDDKSKLLLSNGNTATKNRYARAIDIQVDKTTGNIELPIETTDNDIYLDHLYSLNKEQEVSGKKIKDLPFSNTFDVDFAYSAEKEYLGEPQDCVLYQENLNNNENSAELNALIKAQNDALHCSERQKTNGVLIKYINTPSSNAVYSGETLRKSLRTIASSYKQDINFGVAEATYTGGVYKVNFNNQVSKISENNICDVRYEGNYGQKDEFSITQKGIIKKAACRPLKPFSSNSNDEGEVLPVIRATVVHSNDNSREDVDVAVGVSL